MLGIDDNIFKLARMQEALLKTSSLNREENLKKYKKTVSEIDTKAFEYILEETKHLDEHNHSQKSELEFLQNIKQIYKQLKELQDRFKRICEIYGDNELKLSDLSQLNIEYIENRISAISGYLTNNQNIQTNKERIEQLSTQLSNEEKINTTLRNRLQSLEEELRYNFLHAEGRCFIDERHQAVSVVSEYNKLDIDFELLLTRSDSIENLLVKAKEKRNEAEETLKATRICYELTPNAENKMFLDKNDKELLKAKYKLIMLEILKLLIENYDSYELCTEKREKLLSLIEDRKTCLKRLGIHMAIDPFTRTKAGEQLENIKSMTDNSTLIHNIRKEITELTASIDKMNSQNSNYLITLSNTRSLFESKIGLSDIDVTAIELPFEKTITPKEPAKNQVVEIKSIPNTINMNIIIQKTRSVIKRVYQMINKKVNQKEEPNGVMNPELVVVPRTHNDSKTENLAQSIIPEMVIPDFSNFQEEASTNSETQELVEDIPELVVPEVNNEARTEELTKPTIPSAFIPDFSVFIDDTPKEIEEAQEYDEESEDELESELDDTTLEVGENKTTPNLPDIFETVTPFDEPQLFPDRIDDFSINPKSTAEYILIKNNNPEEQNANNVEITLDSPSEAIEDTFWPTQETISEQEEQQDNKQPSFEDQIQMLIAPDDGNSKVRKKVA